MPWWPWSKKKPKPRKLKEPIERHLGVDLVEAQSVAHEVKAIERVNIQRVLDSWSADSNPPAKVFGFSTTGFRADDELVKYLVTDELIQAPIERIQIDSGPGETLDCVLRGLTLLQRKVVPVVIALRPPRFTGTLPVLEVIGSTRAAARDTMSALLDEARRSSVYKGRTLSVEPGKGWREEPSIRFHQLRATNRDDIVLPDDLIRVVERNVLGMLQHAEVLRAAGRTLRHGLLFHGPPGKGKTMMARYLAKACKDHTVILLTGAAQGLVRESCQIARMLAPSLVVLEDVDLVAEERERNRCPVILHELMNEMEGLAPREEVIFLLTTNRPEIIEPALSARPGRIDQAIEFPLPDEECRKRLFAVYGRGLDLSALVLGRWVTQTNGVSPAFIEELLRKATVMAAERGEASRPLRLTDDDMQDAIRELVYFGGELTQKLLGYRPGRIGYAASAKS